MSILVCSDRDGTINRDENYFLGTSDNWQEQIEFLPGVIEGLQHLNTVPDLHFYILTNQAGVALTGIDSKTGINFDNLTEERMHEVNREIINRLSLSATPVKGYCACPFVDDSYVEKSRQRRRQVNPAYVCNGHPDLKPNIGMISHAARELGFKSLEDLDIYVIGDRDSDVKMGLNAGGRGILVASSKTVERGDLGIVEQLFKDNPGRVYLASDFYVACQLITSNVRSKQD